jgi:hypothetical protein
MPSSNPTGYETYIYDHRAYPRSLDDHRQFRGPQHDPERLPLPEEDIDTTPLIMVEPSYATGSDEIVLMFRYGSTMFLPRQIAEQLRDALAKVCEKPK